MNDIGIDRIGGPPGSPDAGGGAATAPPPPPVPGTPPLERRGRPLLVAAAVAVALIAGAAVGIPIGLLTRGGGSTPSTSATQLPTANSSAAVRARALYQEALNAANRSPGFHYVAVSRGGTGSQTIAGDAGQSGGTQAITMASTYGPEQFSLLLVSGTVYFQGNSPALQDQLGVPAATAPGLAGKWVSVSTGDGPYGVVAPGITVADQVQETMLVPTSSSSNAIRTRILGTLPAQQGGSGPAHLDVAPATHLPIAYVAATTANGTTTTTTTVFSRWGSAPSPAAPAGAVAWSTLGASQPPGGYGSGGTTSPTPQS